MIDSITADRPDGYGRIVLAGACWMALAWAFFVNQQTLAANASPRVAGAGSVMLWVGFAAVTFVLFFLMSVGRSVEQRLAWAARIWIPLTLAVYCIVPGVFVFNAFHAASFAPCIMLLCMGLFIWTGVPAHWLPWACGTLCLAGAITASALSGRAVIVLAAVCLLLVGLARCGRRGGVPTA